MEIALVHKDPVARQILERALRARVHLGISGYSCIEDLMLGSLPYDIYVVYRDLGHKMNGVQGVQVIRGKKPQALIIGVSSTPNTDKAFYKAGANAFLLRSGNEVQELGDMLLKKIAQWVAMPPAQTK